MSTSLAVLQFMAFVTGQWQVQQPANKKQTESVTLQHGMCLACCAMTDMDVIVFQDGNEVSICRACDHTLLNGAPVQADKGKEL